MKTAFVLFFILLFLALKAEAQQTVNTLNVKDLTVTKKLTVNSTTEASKPCPAMTEAERDDLTPDGSARCIYNTDTLTLNVYNGAAWKSAGGGVNQWLTGSSYQVDDVIIESNKFYLCLIAHTAGTFATDLASLNWSEISAFTDTIGIDLKSQDGSVISSVQEIQVPNNSLTETDTNKQLIETGNNNLLANPGFEHSTPATGWTLASGTSAVETSNVKQGKQGLKLTLSAQALNFKQTSTLNATAFADGVNGSISISVKTTVANVYLCRTDSVWAVVASTDGTKITNCVLAPNNGKWSDLVMPIILGATQNGLALVSLTPSTAAAVAVTGDVFVDSGNLEAGLKVASQSVCTTTDCETEFSASIAATTGAVGTSDNYDWINGDCVRTGTSSTTVTCTPATGKFSVTPNCTAIAHLNTAGVHFIKASSSASSLVFTTTDASGTAANIGLDIKCSRSGTDFTNAKALAAGRFYTLPSDSFSTDSNILSHKTSALTSASNIGDYVTYSYAASTNTKTICGSAPSTLPTSANGFLIYTRAYNAASTCGNPARVEIKIGAAGDKFPTLSKEIYKNAGKSISGTLNPVVYTNAIDFGAKINSYDSLTGILTVDTGVAWNASTTTHVISFSDNTDATSGYLVINAQKAKDSIIGSFAEVVTSQGTTKGADIQSVYFGGSAGCGSTCTTGNCVICNPIGSKITSVSFVSANLYSANGIDGTKYNCSGSGYTGAAYVPILHQKVSSTTSYARIESSGNLGFASVTCTGIP